jgi:glycosyltransferase involved in cell wall biosynthesis
LLTWGLLGPGKGIEWALRALALLRGSTPAPIYTVSGRTHPKVLEQFGDAYRNSLKALADALGVTEDVVWRDEYLDEAALSRLIRSADVVVLPYDSTDQVTSGVLIEAVAAGKPVVATCFPHAVELLSGGVGLLVPHRDPVAIAQALRTVLTRPDIAASMSFAAAATSPALRWSVVAEQYRQLAERLITAAAVAA